MNNKGDTTILHVCKEDKATALQRRMAFNDLPYQVDTLFTFKLGVRVSTVGRIVNAIQFRMGYYPEHNDENRKLKEAVSKKHYDIVFIEKGLSIRPSTLRYIRQVSANTKIISYTLDDMMNPHNSSLHYRKSIPLYDFHYTNKNFNVAELKSMGAKEVVYIKNAYSSHVHRPIDVSADEYEYFKADVSFIGTYEEERAGYLLQLARQGIDIKLWGWASDRPAELLKHPHVTHMKCHVYGDDFAKAVAGAKINLCFLRKQNRDTETTRSMEIPACKGFMLAERTPEHLSLFAEPDEAEYFEGFDELLTKVRHYLSHDKERERIAMNGYQRCIGTHKSYTMQLNDIIKDVLNRDL